MVKLKPMIIIFAFLILVLQGCGESESEKPTVVVGEWGTDSNSMASDPKNKDLNKFVLKFAIQLYGREFKIEQAPQKDVLIFKFLGKMPKYYGIQEKKDNLYTIKDEKSGEIVQIEVVDPGRMLLTLPKLEHPLVPKADKPVTVHLVRKKK
ncbi:hypothetical protein ACFLQ0_04835 [Nitrospinota bacterium]